MRVSKRSRVFDLNKESSLYNTYMAGKMPPVDYRKQEQFSRTWWCATMLAHQFTEEGGRITQVDDSTVLIGKPPSSMAYRWERMVLEQHTPFSFGVAVKIDSRDSTIYQLSDWVDGKPGYDWYKVVPHLAALILARSLNGTGNFNQLNIDWYSDIRDITSMASHCDTFWNPLQKRMVDFVSGSSILEVNRPVLFEGGVAPEEDAGPAKEPEPPEPEVVFCSMPERNIKLPEDQEQLVHEVPSYYQWTDAGRFIVNSMVSTWSNPVHAQFRNVLLEGGPGTGKSEWSKALAGMLKSPYAKMTCFADMDSSNILSQIVPHYVEGEVRYDEEVSPFVRAFEHGWVCELAEPTVVADAGALMALSTALEPDGIIQLPDRMIKRHPDFVCVATTNAGLSGTRSMNEALRDRFQMVVAMDLPDRAEIMERLKAITGVDDRDILEKVADLAREIPSKIRELGIYGEVSMRSLIALVIQLAAGVTERDALLSTVVWKLTTDEQEVVEVLDSISALTPFSV